MSMKGERETEKCGRKGTKREEKGRKGTVGIGVGVFLWQKNGKIKLRTWL